MSDDDRPGGAPFRGGFRFVPSEEGGVQVDVWGADLDELLPRAAEALFRAAGVPETLVPAPPFRVECRARDAAALLADLAERLTRMPGDRGRYATAVACRSLVRVRPGGSLPAGLSAVLLCDGGHVSPDADPGLRPMRLAQRAVRVWRERSLLRARLLLRERPARGER